MTLFSRRNEFAAGTSVHPAFYPRFGFSAKLARPLANPFGSGDAWMAMELVPEALAGVKGRVEYPPPFRELE